MSNYSLAWHCQTQDCLEGITKKNEAKPCLVSVPAQTSEQPENERVLIDVLEHKKRRREKAVEYES